MKRKCIAILTAAMLLACPAAGAETIKHERVFAVLRADGTASTILDNVRLENTDALEEMPDVSDLTEIENVSGNETFTVSEEGITWRAGGKDITYRGRGGKALPATPVVSYELDGQPLSARDVASVSGSLRITVTYAQQTALPVLAFTVLPLPEGVDEVQTEHAVLISEGGRQLVVGWGVPGADEALELPDAFTVACRADHAAFEQMLTVVTAEPLQRLLEDTGDAADDAEQLIANLTAILKAMQAGEPLPEPEGKGQEAVRALNELLDGVAQISGGASELSDGAATLESGAGELEEGLAALAANNENLQSGASQLQAAILQAANAQLASAGLDALGITLPELSAQNAGAVLEGAIAQLSDTSTLEAMLREKARAQVAETVEANDQTIRGAVEQAVREQVLEAVLAQLEMPMSASEYAAAVKAQKVPAKQDEQIQATVDAQMREASIAAKLEAAVTEQKEGLIQQNLEGEEARQRMKDAMGAAQAGAQTLAELKQSLDGVNAFVDGLTAYTDGVAQASGGASQLHEGAAALSDAALQLKDGTSTLHARLTEAEKALADEWLPRLERDAVKTLDAVRSMREALADSISYDRIPEDMGHDLAVFIRTEMNR